MRNRYSAAGYSAIAAAACAFLPSALFAAPFTPIPTSNSTLNTPADANHFNFIVTGDNRSTGHGYPMPPCVTEICSEIGLIHPSFVLWTGDVIEGYGDSEQEANAEYDVFLKDASMMGVPVYNAPGNHEFSLDKTLLPIYEKRIGALYGSFNYGNSHFIALNTTGVNADGTMTAGALDDAQWTWLESDLKSTTAKNIFIFLHHYPFGPPDPDTPTMDTGWKDIASRDRFHKLMVQYGVRAVFAGHNHIYWHANKDGVDYYIAGGAGAPLDASPEQGGYLHYVMVHVDDNKISTDILQPWHLDVTYLNGNNGSTTETAWVANTNNADVEVGRLEFHVAAPANGSLTASAVIAGYKGKAPKQVPTAIVSQSTSADGKQVTVDVAVLAKSARTTEVTVGPASATSAAR